ncbi:MAG: hypothetical protein HYY64_07085 [Candidatus Rokubacteria bacterium]|nr:hypothetical protein [Candidatus Rokubacteria bacterium]
MPRMTRDIDIVVELSARDADRVCALFEGDFYVDRDAVRAALATLDTFNIIHHAHVVKVDLIVRKDSEYRREEFGRRRRASVEGHEFAIVAPEDLIISKLDWARDTGLKGDVRNLLASIPDLDREYLGRWSERLGLGDLYREAAR